MSEELVEIPESGAAEPEAPPRPTRKAKTVEAPMLLDGEKIGSDVDLPDEEPEEAQSTASISKLFEKVNSELPEKDRVAPSGDPAADMAKLISGLHAAKNAAFARNRVRDEEHTKTISELKAQLAAFEDLKPMAEEWKAFQARKKEAEWKKALPDPNEDPDGHAAAIAERKIQEAIEQRQRAEQEEQAQAQQAYQAQLQEHANYCRDAHFWGLQNDPDYANAFALLRHSVIENAKANGVPEEQIETVVSGFIAETAMAASMSGVIPNDRIKEWAAANAPRQPEAPKVQAPKRQSNHGARPGGTISNPKPTTHRAALEEDDFFAWAEKRAAGEISDKDIAARILR
jgi:hypothetical protein